MDRSEYVEAALSKGRPWSPCQCDECDCPLHSYDDERRCVWCSNGEHAPEGWPDDGHHCAGYGGWMPFTADECDECEGDA